MTYVVSSRMMAVGLSRRDRHALRVSTLPLCLFYLVLCGIWLQADAGKCIPTEDIDLVNHLRRYVVDGQAQVTMPLTLASSDRVSHRLTTAIFKIFLQEVVGYENVKIVRINDDFNPVQTLSYLDARSEVYTPVNTFPPEEQNFVDHIEPIGDDILDDTAATEQLTGMMSSRSKTNIAPYAMINLEVWLPPGFSEFGVESGSSVTPCGNQGTGGRFGWYVPHNTIQGTNMITDHWRSLQNGDVTKNFRLTPQESSDVKKKYTKKLGGGYFCPEIYNNKPLCEEGVYVPPQCRNSNSCGTVFAGHFEHSSFLARQISDQKLKVQVAWIGPNLTPDFVENFRVNKQIIFITWWPSPLTVLEGFIRVAFPSCTELDSTEANHYLCKYELHTLSKQAWSKLKHFGSFAYLAAERFSLDNIDYEQLLKEYNRVTPLNASDSLVVSRKPGWDNTIIEDIACQFVGRFARTKPTHLRFWAPEDYNKKTVLWVAGIFPLEESPGRYSSVTLIHAAEIAQDDINRNNTLLGDYKLQISFENGQCKSDGVLFSFIKYIRMASNSNSLKINQLIGILGPGCSDTVEPLAGIAKLMNTTLMSYSAEGAIFNDKGKYPNFFRTIPENKLYRYVYIQLVKELNWLRIASLTEDGNKYSEYLTLLQDSLSHENITNVTIFNKKFPRGIRKGMSTYLSFLKEKNYRIIIADFYADMACEVMCEAYHLDMTLKNGYVWFLPSWFHPNWFDVDNGNYDHITCTTNDLLTALDGHMALGYAYYAPDEAVYHSGKTIKEWKDRYEAEYHKPPADYAGYTYDAVWTYAFALDKLIKEDLTHVANMRSEKTSKRFLELLRETNFTGISGHIQFGGGPSRKSAVVNVMQFRADPDMNTSQYNIVGQFYPDSSLKYGGRLNLDKDKINWFSEDNLPPSDGTVQMESNCVLHSLSVLLGVNCQVTIVVLMMLIFFLFTMAVVFGFFVYRIKFKSKYMLPEKKNFFEAYELPRENVVINRTIGEGAFGTVFGGECMVPGDSAWKAVAVKTLKLGSNEGEKMDFLAEAEMMTRFDNENIVKLIGVCTQGKPYYLVMEFMLYGDLKTYLLARRHLVNERTASNDDDEVSSKRLTSIALDVARGLEYLGKGKFVHRDVACRNCLINANRVAKLSDFGLTRPVFDTNYYRFLRKGFLPVRWMAPESLSEQLYTKESDMWSYGILLYEIITFGNFPFQGMENCDVITYIKNGNTPTLPLAIKSDLATLLHYIWTKDPRHRPSFTDLVEMFISSPRLIKPCLEDPLASVQINDSVDIDINDLNRKVSVPKPNKPSCNSGEQSSITEESLPPTLIIDPNNPTLFSSNSVVCGGPSSLIFDRRVPRSENGHCPVLEPLLPLTTDSYIGRYACLRLGKSPDSAENECKTPGTTTV